MRQAVGLLIKLVLCFPRPLAWAGMKDAVGVEGGRPACLKIQIAILWHYGVAFVTIFILKNRASGELV